MEIRPILSALLRSKTGAILVALQVAISLAILSNALHIVNLRQAVAVRPSGIVDESAIFNINIRHLVDGTHNEQLARRQAELATLRALPGVVSVSYANQLPMSRSGNTTTVTADRSQVEESAGASMYWSPDSLVKTWGLKLAEGRDLRPEEVIEFDGNTSPEDVFPKSVLVTKALADKVWPGAPTAIGKTLFFGRGENANATTVVGVIETLQSQGAEVQERGSHAVILPMYFSFGRTIFTVRTEAGQRDRVMKEAEAAIRAAARTPVITKLKTADEDRKERYRADTALAWMLITVCVLLLLVTASGIVGMASLWVTQRRKQIGVRRALGARRVDILRYFITENFMITSVGVLCGVLMAIGLNQLLVSQLEMARLPVLYLISGAGVFWVLGVFAVYGPAFRAATISPATATRSA